MERVIALGFFDGVHLGHGQLLSRCRQEADRLGCQAAALTFDRHPDTLVLGTPVRLLSSLPDRKKLMSQLYGVEEVLTLQFDEAMRDMAWTDFLQDILVNRYHVHSSTLGRGRSGPGQAVFGPSPFAVWQSGAGSTSGPDNGHSHRQSGARSRAATAPPGRIRLPGTHGHRRIHGCDQYRRPAHRRRQHTHGGAVASGLSRRPIRPGGDPGIVALSPARAEVPHLGGFTRGNPGQCCANPGVFC